MKSEKLQSDILIMKFKFIINIDNRHHYLTLGTSNKKNL